jgi:hypothetical protein
MTPSTSRKAQRRKKARAKKESRKSRLGNLEKKVRDRFPGEEMAFVPSEIKMSEVLLDFVAPYQDAIDDTKESLGKLLTIAVAAWNMSLLPEEKQRAILNDLAKALPSDKKTQAGFREIVASLIARKKVHFAEYDRFIIEFDVIDQGDNYYVTVASTAEPQ